MNVRMDSGSETAATNSDSIDPGTDVNSVEDSGNSDIDVPVSPNISLPCSDSTALPCTKPSPVSGTSSGAAATDDVADEDVPDADVFVADAEDETPKSLEIAMASKQEGNSHYKEGNYDLALDSYSNAIETCPLENTSDLVSKHISPLLKLLSPLYPLPFSSLVLGCVLRQSRRLLRCAEGARSGGGGLF